MDYKYLLDLAIILLCTKVLGLATRKIQMPQVVGALLAGLLLGPAVGGVRQKLRLLRRWQNWRHCFDVLCGLDGH